MHATYTRPAPAPVTITTDTQAPGTTPIPGVTPRPGLAHLALKLLPKPPAHAATYAVQPGDCLWTISEHFYGNGGDFMTIYDANRSIIHTPGLITPGMVLVIPGASSPAPAAPAPPAPAPPPASPLPASSQAPQPGMSWSIFSQLGGQRLAVSYAAALLRQLGAPVTPGNLQVIYDWQVSEGSGGWYNPLNGGDFAGLAVSGEQYGGGANNYPSLSVNVRAMAGILLNDTQYGYDAVVSALRANDPGAARTAIINSQWAASHYNWGASFSGAPLPG